MKKLFTICLTSFLIFGLVGCSNKEEKPVEEPVVENTTEPSTEPVEVVSPFIEVKDMNELREKVGFDFDTPEAIDTANVRKFLVYEDFNMAEVLYLDGEEQFAFVRKIQNANIEEDVDSISGVYVEFDETVNLENYKLSKIKGISYIADWTEGDYTYSLVLLNGASDDVIMEIAKTIK